jgi:hypothetical protein
LPAPAMMAQSKASTVFAIRSSSAFEKSSLPKLQLIT